MLPEENNSNKPDVNTDGGAFTGGNVESGGDFIGRDQNVHGDVVKGNKIVIQTTASVPLAQPAKSSSPWRRAVTINTTLIGVFSFLGAIATNIATGVLPETWKPYLWVAWPLAVLITAISIWLTLRQSSLEDADSPLPLTLEQRNRQVMLKQVRLDWIDGVLNRSLYREVLISLGLEERPEAIVRPFDAQVQRPNQKPQPLPVGTKIIDVFDQVGGSLLILGAPGAGKTTILIELARDLLDRAENDERQLIPVVFNLSSLAVEKQTLAEWLIKELNNKYHISLKIAQVWIETDQVLPLLDGLDEVNGDYRAQCVDAINTFHHTHKFVGMIVCSRVADYEALQAKLSLQSAVLVQPLTKQQVDEYLKGLGKPLTGVRAALRDDPKLWELIETPLWLSIATLAYQGLSPQKLRAAATLEDRRSEILNAYIQAMFNRRSKELQHSRQQTIAWLTWLARQMVQHSQMIFLIEQVGPDWLDNPRQFAVYGLVVGLVVGLLGGLVGGLVDGLAIGLFVGLVGGLNGGMLGAMSGGRVGCRIGGLVGGLLVIEVGGALVMLDGWLGGGLLVVLLVGLVGGLVPCIMNFSLRYIFYCEKRMPWNYVRFLDYCVDRIFLRRVGGGYIFIHRLVMEHFASLTDEDIAKIASDAKNQ